MSLLLNQKKKTHTGHHPPKKFQTKQNNKACNPPPPKKTLQASKSGKRVNLLRKKINSLWKIPFYMSKPLEPLLCQYLRRATVMHAYVPI